MYVSFFKFFEAVLKYSGHICCLFFCLLPVFFLLLLYHCWTVGGAILVSAVQCVAGQRCHGDAEEEHCGSLLSGSGDSSAGYYLCCLPAWMMEAGAQGRLCFSVHTVTSHHPYVFTAQTSALGQEQETSGTWPQVLSLF